MHQHHRTLHLHGLSIPVNAFYDPYIGTRWLFLSFKSAIPSFHVFPVLKNSFAQAIEYPEVFRVGNTYRHRSEYIVQPVAIRCKSVRDIISRANVYF